jgi:hypothetical protein
MATREALSYFLIDLVFPAMDQPHKRGIMLEELEGELPAYSVPTMNLDGRIRRLEGHICRGFLGQCH